jgi:hypothetical protein
LEGEEPWHLGTLEGEEPVQTINYSNTTNAQFVAIMDKWRSEGKGASLDEVPHCLCNHQELLTSSLESKSHQQKRQLELITSGGILAEEAHRLAETKSVQAVAAHKLALLTIKGQQSALALHSVSWNLAQ